MPKLTAAEKDLIKEDQAKKANQSCFYSTSTQNSLSFVNGKSKSVERLMVVRQCSDPDRNKVLIDRQEEKDGKGDAGLWGGLSGKQGLRMFWGEGDAAAQDPGRKSNDQPARNIFDVFESMVGGVDGGIVGRGGGRHKEKER